MVAQDGGRFNLLPRTIVTYSISHLSQTDKVRFYYALKGRNGTGGLISQIGLYQLAKTVILVDSNQEKQLIDFLIQWDCRYSTMPVMVRGTTRNHPTINHPLHRTHDFSTPTTPKSSTNPHQQKTDLPPSHQVSPNEVRETP